MLRDDLDDLDINGNKGDWCFMNGDALIAIRYREDAFMGTVIIPISEGIVSDKPHWKWNGSKEFPTLSPSILVHGTPGWSDEWHGYLEHGILREI